MKTQDKINSTFSSERTLEITYWIIGIAMVILLLIGSNLSAKNPPLTEESYIDDIPFNTEKVVDEMIMPALDFDDELYIDDIPFSTADIVVESDCNSAVEVNFEMEDEAYIDDVPFSTSEVVKTCAFNEAMNHEFQLEDETYINDIPFNTQLVAEKAAKNMNIYLYTTIK